MPGQKLRNKSAHFTEQNHQKSEWQKAFRPFSLPLPSNPTQVPCTRSRFGPVPWRCRTWRCSKWRIPGTAPTTRQASHCLLFISGALSYGAVRDSRADGGGCGPLGRHCTRRGNHLYSTPEVTEEHEIGKQLKHHSAREALGTEESSCFRGEGL